MSEPIIRVDGLGKRYRLRHQTAGGYRALRDVLADTARGAAARLRGRRPARAGTTEEFWALRDVSFAVRPGEVVGVIGRNGAGKSTLLKVLSRITEPTTGRVTLDGRVASLLEVGTGFHPELTGRENVYLNGSILGMSRAEVRRKFDEIVAFAEVERFLDTPVKRYSSGMYVRLAFAVAAHLEPEILIVDEVLAVGDQEFQKKCLGKMGEVARGGRTVLFVSHNMAAVQVLCGRAVILAAGRVAADGPTAEVIPKYLAGAASAGEYRRSARPAGVCVVSATAATADTRDGLELRLRTVIRADRPDRVSLDVRVLDAFGAAVGFSSLGSLDERLMLNLAAGDTLVESAHAMNLGNGSYTVSLDLSHPNIAYLDRADSCLAFEVQRPPAGGAFRRLEQRWGYGAVEFDARLVSLSVNPVDG